MAITDISAERLREHFTFDPESGTFRSLIDRKKGPNPWRAGEVIPAKGGTMILDGNVYSSSKVAWLYHYGAWPRTRLIFLNGDIKDVRISNMMERSSGDDLTADRLRTLLSYNPETGVFTRNIRTSNRINVGDVAGSATEGGYWAIKIDGKSIKSHRLAWLYTYGCWPTNEIDHINGDPADNRIENLRDVSHEHNTQNTRRPRIDNASGFLGVHACNGGYMASINASKKSIKMLQLN